MYTYFVSFNYFVEEGEKKHVGSGNTSVQRETPFTHISDFTDLGNEISSRHNYPEGSVVIMNYQLLG